MYYVIYKYSYIYIYIFYIFSVSYCSIEVGTFAHLKNSHQGLRYQLTRCQSQHAAATASEDAQAAQEARHRLAWIYEKHLVPMDLLCCQKAPGVVGCSVGSCNSTHAWPSSNTRGWNSIYASSTPSGCDSTQRRSSKEGARHARGRSHDQVEGEADHLSMGE